MHSLGLTFNSLTGWTLDPRKLVTGFATTVQCGLVNVTTQRGTHGIFPEAGTNLMLQGAFGLLLDIPAAKHECNFAAAEAKEFVNSQTPSNDLEIDQFNMQPVSLSGGSLQLELRVVSLSGETYGELLEN